MKPEDKVTSRKRCQKLFELEITKGIETERVWAQELDKTWNVYSKHDYLAAKKLFKQNNLLGRVYFNWVYIPAPDLSELGELLPNGSDSTILNKEKNHYLASCPENSKHIVPRRTFLADTEANARANMLIALKQELLKAGKK